MQQFRGASQLLEVIADDPVSEGIGTPLDAFHAVEYERCAECLVDDGGKVRWRYAPFCPPDFYALKTIGLERLPYVQRQVAVGVGRDEVQGKLLPANEVQEVDDPFCCRAGGTSHEKALIDRLDGTGSNLVESEIFFLGAGPEYFEVGFVPDLEAPLTDLLDAVAFHQVRGEMMVQFSPAIPVAWRRDDASVCEDGGFGVGCQVVRHEREFYDGPQTYVQQPVIDAVNAGEIVLSNSVDLAIHMLRIIQDGMSTYVRGSQFGLRNSQGLRELFTDIVASWP